MTPYNNSTSSIRAYLSFWLAIQAIVRQDGSKVIPYDLDIKKNRSDIQTENGPKDPGKPLTAKSNSLCK